MTLDESKLNQALTGIQFSSECANQCNIKRHIPPKRKLQDEKLVVELFTVGSLSCGIGTSFKS